MANQTSLLRSALHVLSVNCCRYNSNAAVLTRVKRSKYPRLYPTRVVNPDGSTYTIRYEIPRQIICVCHSAHKFVFDSWRFWFLDFTYTHIPLGAGTVVKKQLWVRYWVSNKFLLWVRLHTVPRVELPEDTKTVSSLTQIFRICVYKITKFSRVIVFIMIVGV